MNLINATIKITDAEGREIDLRGDVFVSPVGISARPLAGDLPGEGVDTVRWGESFTVTTYWRTRRRKRGTRQQRRTAATRIEQWERTPWMIEPHDAGEWRGFWRAFYALGLRRDVAARRRAEHHRPRRRDAQRAARIWFMSEVPTP